MADSHLDGAVGPPGQPPGAEDVEISAAGPAITGLSLQGQHQLENGAGHQQQANAVIPPSTTTAANNDAAVPPSVSGPSTSPPSLIPLPRKTEEPIDESPPAAPAKDARPEVPSKAEDDGTPASLTAPAAPHPPSSIPVLTDPAAMKGVNEEKAKPEKPHRGSSLPIDVTAGTASQSDQAGGAGADGAMSPSKMLRGIAMGRSRSTEGSRDRGRKWKRKEALMGQAGLRALRDSRSSSMDDDTPDNAAPPPTSAAGKLPSLIPVRNLNTESPFSPMTPLPSSVPSSARTLFGFGRPHAVVGDNGSSDRLSADDSPMTPSAPSFIQKGIDLFRSKSNSSQLSRKSVEKEGTDAVTLKRPSQPTDEVKPPIPAKAQAPETVMVLEQASTPKTPNPKVEIIETPQPQPVATKMPASPSTSKSLPSSIPIPRPTTPRADADMIIPSPPSTPAPSADANFIAETDSHAASVGEKVRDGLKNLMQLGKRERHDDAPPGERAAEDAAAHVVDTSAPSLMQRGVGLFRSKSNGSSRSRKSAEKEDSAAAVQSKEESRPMDEVKPTMPAKAVASEAPVVPQEPTTGNQKLDIANSENVEKPVVPQASMTVTPASPIDKPLPSLIPIPRPSSPAPVSNPSANAASVDAKGIPEAAAAAVGDKKIHGLKNLLHFGQKKDRPHEGEVVVAAIAPPAKDASAAPTVSPKGTGIFRSKSKEGELGRKSEDRKHVAWAAEVEKGGQPGDEVKPDVPGKPPVAAAEVEATVPAITEATALAEAVKTEEGVAPLSPITTKALPSMIPVPTAPKHEDLPLPEVPIVASDPPSDAIAIQEIDVTTAGRHNNIGDKIKDGFKHMKGIKIPAMSFGKKERDGALVPEAVVVEKDSSLPRPKRFGFGHKKAHDAEHVGSATPDIKDVVVLGTEADGEDEEFDPSSMDAHMPADLIPHPAPLAEVVETLDPVPEEPELEEEKDLPMPQSGGEAITSAIRSKDHSAPISALAQAAEEVHPETSASTTVKRARSVKSVRSNKSLRGHSVDGISADEAELHGKALGNFGEKLKGGFKNLKGIKVHFGKKEKDPAAGAADVDADGSLPRAKRGISFKGISRKATDGGEASGHDEPPVEEAPVLPAKVEGDVAAVAVKIHMPAEETPEHVPVAAPELETVAKEITTPSAGEANETEADDVLVATELPKGKPEPPTLMQRGMEFLGFKSKEEHESGKEVGAASADALKEGKSRLTEDAKPEMPVPQDSDPSSASKWAVPAGEATTASVTEYQDADQSLTDIVLPDDLAAPDVGVDTAAPYVPLPPAHDSKTELPPVEAVATHAPFPRVPLIEEHGGLTVSTAQPPSTAKPPADHREEHGHNAFGKLKDGLKNFKLGPKMQLGRKDGEAEPEQAGDTSLSRPRKFQFKTGAKKAAEVSELLMAAPSLDVATTDASADDGAAPPPVPKSPSKATVDPSALAARMPTESVPHLISLKDVVALDTVDEESEEELPPVPVLADAAPVVINGGNPLPEFHVTTDDDVVENAVVDHSEPPSLIQRGLALFRSTPKDVPNSQPASDVKENPIASVRVVAPTDVPSSEPNLSNVANLPSKDLPTAEGMNASGAPTEEIVTKQAVVATVVENVAVEEIKPAVPAKVVTPAEAVLTDRPDVVVPAHFDDSSAPFASFDRLKERSIAFFRSRSREALREVPAAEAEASIVGAHTEDVVTVAVEEIRPPQMMADAAVAREAVSESKTLAEESQRAKPEIVAVPGKAVAPTVPPRGASMAPLINVAAPEDLQTSTAPVENTRFFKKAKAEAPDTTSPMQRSMALLKSISKEGLRGKRSMESVRSEDVINAEEASIDAYFQTDARSTPDVVAAPAKKDGLGRDFFRPKSPRPESPSSNRAGFSLFKSKDGRQTPVSKETSDNKSHGVDEMTPAASGVLKKDAAESKKRPVALSGLKFMKPKATKEADDPPSPRQRIFGLFKGNSVQYANDSTPDRVVDGETIVTVDEHDAVVEVPRKRFDFRKKSAPREGGSDASSVKQRDLAMFRTRTTDSSATVEEPRQQSEPSSPRESTFALFKPRAVATPTLHVVEQMAVEPEAPIVLEEDIYILPDGTIMKPAADITQDQPSTPIVTITPPTMRVPVRGVSRAAEDPVAAKVAVAAAYEAPVAAERPVPTELEQKLLDRRQKMDEAAASKSKTPDQSTVGHVQNTSSTVPAIVMPSSRSESKEKVVEGGEGQVEVPDASPVAPAIPKAVAVAAEVVPELANDAAESADESGASIKVEISDVGHEPIVRHSRDMSIEPPLPATAIEEHNALDGSSIHADVDADMTPTDVPSDGVETDVVTNAPSTIIIPESVAAALEEEAKEPGSLDLSVRRSISTPMFGLTSRRPHTPSERGWTLERRRSTRTPTAEDDRSSVGRGNHKVMDWIRGVFKKGENRNSLRATSPTSPTSGPSSPISYHMPDLAHGRAPSANRSYRVSTSSAVVGSINEPDSFRPPADTPVPQSYTPQPPSPSRSPIATPVLKNENAPRRAKTLNKKRSYKLFGVPVSRPNKSADTRYTSSAPPSLPLPDLDFIGVPEAPSRTASPPPRTDSRATSPTPPVQPLPVDTPPPTPPKFVSSDLEKLYHDLCWSGLSIAEIATIHKRISEDLPTSTASGVPLGVNAQGGVPLNREVGSGSSARVNIPQPEVISLPWERQGLAQTDAVLVKRSMDGAGWKKERPVVGSVGKKRSSGMEEIKADASLGLAFLNSSRAT
ncbi:hypothetical protein HK101_009463 [Irineochytrium annulatum]|nr:hypothetical protein HK101_009463 [Irineochytrium annulatum]